MKNKPTNKKSPIVGKCNWCGSMRMYHFVNTIARIDEPDYEYWACHDCGKVSVYVKE